MYNPNPLKSPHQQSGKHCTRHPKVIMLNSQRRPCPYFYPELRKCASSFSILKSKSYAVPILKMTKYLKVKVKSGKNSLAANHVIHLDSGAQMGETQKLP